jgi:hypothetical protein
MVFEAPSWKWSRAVTFPIEAAWTYGAECNLFKDFQLLVSAMNQHATLLKNQIRLTAVSAGIRLTRAVAPLCAQGARSEASEQRPGLLFIGSMRPLVTARRFPPPWSVEELDACFIRGEDWPRIVAHWS